MSSISAIQLIDDTDEAAYIQHVDALAFILDESAACHYRAVLAALIGGDRVSDLLPDDLEVIDELALLGLVEHGQPTELGYDVLIAR